jgi:myo-inositol-1(or 4)-monophosphatase
MAVLHPLLTTAIRAARRAGSLISRASLDLDGVAVSKKRKNDFVTEVDRAAEQAIVDIVHKAYPDHGILAEESGVSGARNADFEWIIDPLDGTLNFIHGFPQYAVSIGIRHRGVLQHGCVFDPTKNELFTTSRGRGAFLNDRRIRVSRRTQLRDALVGTGFPNRDGEGLEEHMAMFRRATEHCAGIRRAGAAALDLAYVACGRLDGFWETTLMPWDMAAGALMVIEAGGLVSDLDESERYLESGNIVSGTPKVFVPLVQLLNGAIKSAPALQAGGDDEA